MESYLQACDLWDLVEADPHDSPIAHMRNDRDIRPRHALCSFRDNFYKDHDM